jgi:hypothetical protein
MMRKAFSFVVALVVVVAPVIGVSGCGGSGAAQPAAVVGETGRATITVRWPEPGDSRLIPAAANSIRVTLTDEENLNVGEATLTRAQPTATFPQLPVGPVTVRASAHPNADGSGIAQASATGILNVVANADTPITLTLLSTIVTLELLPNTDRLGAGTTQQYSATARNAAGEIVLTAPSTFAWSVTSGGSTSVGGGNAASVSDTGLVTALRPGTTTLSVTETESGKSASRALTVFTAVTVRVTPDSVTLSPAQTRTFTATVEGLPAGADAGVTWTALGGQITQTGEFTAVNLGNFSVTATSKYDPSKSGAAAVRIKYGTLNAEVD